MLHSAGCDKYIYPGQERGERPLSQQLHLHIYLEVFGLEDLSLQVDSSGIAVELTRAEVALFIAFCDADDNLVTGVRRGRSDPEDLCWNDDVGLEAELVVGDPHGGVLTLQGVTGTVGPVTASANKPGEEEETSGLCLLKV